MKPKLKHLFFSEEERAREGSKLAWLVAGRILVEYTHADDDGAAAPDEATKRHGARFGDSRYLGMGVYESMGQPPGSKVPPLNIETPTFDTTGAGLTIPEWDHKRPQVDPAAIDFGKKAATHIDRVRFYLKNGKAAEAFKESLLAIETAAHCWACQLDPVLGKTKAVRISMVTEILTRVAITVLGYARLDQLKKAKKNARNKKTK